MDNSRGAHPIHRSILEHWLWRDKPFTRGQVWIDLILLANHKDSQCIIKGNVINVKKGQLLRSKVKLAERWGWTRGRTERFLKLLENEQMIEQQPGQYATIITLLNYTNLHERAFKKRATGATTDSTTDGTTDSTHTINENNDKKHKYASFCVFWDLHPKRHGKKRLKPEAEAYWMKHIANGKTEKVITAVKNFANSESVKQGIGIRDPVRFLKNEYWREWLEPEEKPGGKKTYAQITPDDYLKNSIIFEEVDK